MSSPELSSTLLSALRQSLHSLIALCNLPVVGRVVVVVVAGAAVLVVAERSENDQRWNARSEAEAQHSVHHTLVVGGLVVVEVVGARVVVVVGALVVVEVDGVADVVVGTGMVVTLVVRVVVVGAFVVVDVVEGLALVVVEEVTGVEDVVDEGGSAIVVVVAEGVPVAASHIGTLDSFTSSLTPQRHWTKLEDLEYEN